MVWQPPTSHSRRAGAAPETRYYYRTGYRYPYRTRPAPPTEFCVVNYEPSFVRVRDGRTRVRGEPERVHLI